MTQLNKMIGPQQQFELWYGVIAESKKLKKYSVTEATTNEEYAIKMQTKTIRHLRKNGFSVCTKNKNLDKYDWYVHIIKLHIDIDPEYDE